MRKKPDILLLLSVLVVSGVIISNFVVMGHSDKATTNLSLLNTQYSKIQIDAMKNPASNNVLVPKLNSQELVRIDLSKQRIR